MEFFRDPSTGLVTGKKLVDDGWTSDLDEEQFVAMYLDKDGKYTTAEPFVADLDTIFLVTDDASPSSGSNNNGDNGDNTGRDSDFGGSEECANIGRQRLRRGEEGEDMWRDMPQARLKKLVHFPSTFCNQMAQVCARARVRICAWPACVEARCQVDRLVPSCRWTSFRAFAVQSMACLLPFRGRHAKSSGCLHILSVVKAMHLIIRAAKERGSGLEDYLVGKNDRRASIDVFGVCEVVYWMLTVAHARGFVAVLERRWDASFLPPAVSEPAVLRAAVKARDLGLCPNRFWNITAAAERKHIDLPGLMEFAASHGALRHEGHDLCSSSYCRLAVLLDATKLKQTHKCVPRGQEGSCHERLIFDPRLLDASVARGEGTVWTTKAPFQVARAEQPYVAFSHVWSDGTGVGVQPAGDVNACLFRFLAGMVEEELGCSAIWWDTISIPTDPDMRRKAINEMHRNYADAECTLLHDEYLIDFPWADDGSPCLAIVLSPWFTRGWTALELIMSRKVKVIFGNPVAGGPLVVKDLDDEILAGDPAKCTRGHWVASTILRRLREPVDNLTNLAAILKPRDTSWPRDKMVIAALLAGVDGVDYSLKPDEITKRIANATYRINRASLHHGQPPIAAAGGWSWCPPSIYDLPSDTAGDLWRAEDEGYGTCMVDKHGVLVGYWHFRPLERRDSQEGCWIPNSDHLDVVLQIRDALRQWRYCLLLRENNINEGPGLLVVPIYDRHDFIDCRFVGSVIEAAAATPVSMAQRPGVLDKRYRAKGFRIGSRNSEVGSPMLGRTCHRNATPPDDGDDSSELSAIDDHAYQWMSGRIWIGDHRPQGQVLVTRYLRKGNITEGVALRFAEEESTKPREAIKTIGGIPLYCARPRVAFSEGTVFQAGEGMKDPNPAWIVEGVVAQMTWPPLTIPADERTCVRGFLPSEDDDGGDDERESFDLFCLSRGPASKKRTTYAALCRDLYTPNEERPYSGIWTGMLSPWSSRYLGWLTVLCKVSHLETATSFYSSTSCGRTRTASKSSS